MLIVNVCMYDHKIMILWIEIGLIIHKQGHAYNTFPKMGDTWIPGDIFSMEPFIRNFFENTSTVQLDHRILATTTLCSIAGLWAATRKLEVHPAVKSLIGNTLGLVSLQVLCCFRIEILPDDSFIQF